MKKKLFFLFGILLLIASCSYDATRAYQYGGYHFKQIDNRSVSFCGFASDEAARAAQAVSRTFVIPETIYGQPVTKIEREAFMSSALFDQIVVPKTVTVIGRAAFYNCSAKIDISGNVITDEGHLPPETSPSGKPNAGGGNSGIGSGGSNTGSGVNQYAGSYSGTYRLFDAGMGQEMNGYWSGTVDNNGQMTIRFDGMQEYAAISPTGQFSVTSAGLTIQGSISSNGRVNGTIIQEPVSGTFEGNRS